MAISYLDRDFFQKNSEPDEVLFIFEQTLNSISPHESPLVKKSLLYRHAFRIFDLFSRREEKPLTAVVYLGWLIDGFGAVPLGNERFLEITAQTKNIIVIRKRE